MWKIMADYFINSWNKDYNNSRNKRLIQLKTHSRLFSSDVETNSRPKWTTKRWLKQYQLLSFKEPNNWNLLDSTTKLTCVAIIRTTLQCYGCSTSLLIFRIHSEFMPWTLNLHWVHSRAMPSKVLPQASHGGEDSIFRTNVIGCWWFLSL